MTGPGERLPPPVAPGPAPLRGSGAWGTARIAALILGITALFLAARALPLGGWCVRFCDTLRDGGAPAAALFALVYAIAALFMLPAGIFTLIAGFVYGPIGGLLLVLPVSVAAGTLAFWLGRGLARGPIHERLERSARFAAIDRAIGLHGKKIVFLLRLSPLFPYNVLNYALGLTHVRTLDFVLASAAGLLPATFLYVYVGSLAGSALDIVEGRTSGAGPWQATLNWGGLAATVLATAVIARAARQSLSEELADAAGAAEGTR